MRPALGGEMRNTGADRSTANHGPAADSSEAAVREPAIGAIGLPTARRVTSQSLESRFCRLPSMIAPNTAASATAPPPATVIVRPAPDPELSRVVTPPCDDTSMRAEPTSPLAHDMSTSYVPGRTVGGIRSVNAKCPLLVISIATSFGISSAVPVKFAAFGDPAQLMRNVACPPRRTTPGVADVAAPYEAVDARIATAAAAKEILAIAARRARGIAELPPSPRRRGVHTGSVPRVRARGPRLRQTTETRRNPATRRVASVSMPSPTPCVAPEIMTSRGCARAILRYADRTAGR